MQVLLNMLFEFIHCVLVILDDLWVLQLLICSYDSVGEMGAIWFSGGSGSNM